MKSDSSLRPGPETGNVSPPLYYIGKNSHKGHLEIRVGHKDPTSLWEEWQGIYYRDELGGEI